MNVGLLEHIRTFTRAVETGSFTAVAAEQGQSQPTVSRQISALEEHLGVRLLHRSTRALALTDEGRAYYAQALALLDAAEQAAATVRPGAAAVAGMLRVAVPLAFARLHVMPRLGRFLAAHPAIRTDWLLGDGTVDLVDEGVDLAIRIGDVADQTLVARRIGTTRRITVATPGYFAHHTPPKHPLDLRDHDCIVYTGLATGDEWHFNGPDGAPVAIRVAGRVRVSASEGMRAAVLEGLGVAVVPTWLLTNELEAGILVRVLEAFEPAPRPIQAVHPSRRMVPPRVRAFVDFLHAEFRADPRLA